MNEWHVRRAETPIYVHVPLSTHNSTAGRSAIGARKALLGPYAQRWRTALVAPTLAAAAGMTAVVRLLSGVRRALRALHHSGRAGNLKMGLNRVVGSQLEPRLVLTRTELMRKCKFLTGIHK